MLYSNDNETVDNFDASKNKIMPNLICNILFCNLCNYSADIYLIDICFFLDLNHPCQCFISV